MKSGVESTRTDLVFFNIFVCGNFEQPENEGPQYFWSNKIENKYASGNCEKW